MPDTIAALGHEVLNVSPKTNWSFVSVRTGAGEVAWGEASLNAWEPMQRGAVELLAQRVCGLTVDQAREALAVSPYSPGGLVHASAVSAVQQALLELTSRARGQAWSATLGGARRERLRAYANINRATTERTPAGFVATARRAAGCGFTAFKAAPFDGLTPATCPTAEGRRRLHHGIDCMLAIREAVGPDARLMVDCHWRFDEPRALEALQALAPARLHWFECPLPEMPMHWPALRRVRAAARDRGVLLAAAETQVGVAGFEPLFEADLYDVVMPDVKYCGGPWEMLRIAEHARANGVQCSPHNPTGPIASLHSLSVAAAAPWEAMVEIQFDESPLFDRLVPGAHPRLVDGAFGVATDATLQIAPDASLFRAHPYVPVPPGVEALAAG
ncbi:MAG TPA: mandelate racemase/muconate lactonizing enzyme family protein [Burkholderiaceae bacterium]|nr:mandelate racemase/muconate lactonizing enzyme family protein [Burkholderiaceae bacterium]